MPKKIIKYLKKNNRQTWKFNKFKINLKFKY